MEIFLIRHGETTGDIEDKYGGDYDDNLTKKGTAQANKLGRKLEGKGIQIIYSSPLIRAQETSKILSKFLGVEIKTVKDIKERNRYGILTGITKKEAKEKHPQAFEDVKDFKNTIEAAEEYEEFVGRITNAFSKLLKVDYETIAVVTHGGPLYIIFEKVLSFKWGRAEDCGFAVLDVKNGEINVLSSEGISFKEI